MFVASVSTLIFNLNPLLRFDGYYILSDLIEIPNLNQRAARQLRYLSERWLFGVKQADSPAERKGEAIWYATYGISSGIYRVVVFSGVLFAIADRFLVIGMIMAAVCLVSWVTVPVIRFGRYLTTSPQLDRVRSRAFAVTGAIAMVIIILLGVVPFPHGFRAPGVVKTAERTALSTKTSGRLTQFFAKPGAAVKRGQPLARLENPELEVDLAGARAHLEEVDARLLKAMKTESAELAPLNELRVAIAEQIQKFSTDLENLTVRAPHDGNWVAPGAEDYQGRWLTRGSNLGLVVNPERFEFVATVPQEDVDALFKTQIRGAKVRLAGDAATPLPLKNWRVVPGEQNALPSAVLGWAAGGEIPVASDDSSGSKAVEPFFEVVGSLEQPTGLSLLDGRSGKVGFKLPSEPLLPRWLRRAWQLLQRRYQI
jgi:putative peptide zinc metalloprotease protein